MPLEFITSERRTRMSKQILIDSYFGLVRTAIAEGASLLDYYEESPDQGRTKGNIYRGVVKKVDAPIQAAFVRFGGGRDGFLPMRDAGSGSKAPKVGDTVLVQVIKDEVGDKGAALTTKLSLSGRYLVYIPERESEGGISSRITDDERAALKKILGELQIPEGGSIILRTAAMNKGTGELQADLDRLTETYREISDKFSAGKEPGLLFREAPPALRYLREYYAPEVDRIWVNQEEVLDQCRQFFYLYEPKSAAKVVLSKDGPLMFQKLGLDADVERLTSRKVSLPSGANIVIDQAEALVAIDVNSAKAGGRGEDGKRRSEAKGGSVKDGSARDGAEKPRSSRGRANDLEATVFAVNLEAAEEIARQLRLRDLGGIIIVDFIDMEDEKHRRQIEEVMRRALAPDKAKVKVYDISPLGIMQISRQRLRKAGPHFSRQGCESCQGRGWHPSPAAGALAALRKMEERLHGKKAGQSLMVSAPYPVANKLINEFRDHVVGMEKRFGCTLRVTALPAASGEATIASQGPGGEDVRAREPEARGRDATPAGERSAGDRHRGEGRQEGRGEGRIEGRGQGRGEARNQGRDQGRGDGRGRRSPARGTGEKSQDATGIGMETGSDPIREMSPEGRYSGDEAEGYGTDAKEGSQGIHPELIRAFDELHAPSGTPVKAPNPNDDVQAGVASESPVPGSGGIEPAKETGGRSRGRSRPSRARAPAGASDPEAARESAEAPKEGHEQRGPGRHRRPEAERSESRPREAAQGGRKPAPRAAQPARPARVKAAEPPARAPIPAGRTAQDQENESPENPRRRSRRRSRRGKGGGAPKDGGGAPTITDRKENTPIIRKEY
ncbi:MAG: rne [Fibrobacteres bacterium]|nr:rne [Fibrobacterota bacterium]